MLVRFGANQGIPSFWKMLCVKRKTTQQETAAESTPHAVIGAAQQMPVGPHIGADQTTSLLVVMIFFCALRFFLDKMPPYARVN